jgi:hypothetical protein
MGIMSRILPIGLILLAIGTPLRAQDWTPEPGAGDLPKPPPQEVLKLDREVGELAQQLGDWSGQYPVIEDVVRNIWKDNGWTSEADLFARDTAMEVSRIPPWQFNQRMTKLADAIDGRYQLNDQQRGQLRTLVYKESLHMLGRYGATTLGNFREMLQSRLDGEPITPEQVARWEKAMDPLIGDLRKDIERLRGEFGGMLNEDQKKILERDLQSANRRMDHYLKAREAWKRGEWQASDWGLQDDPVQNGRGSGGKPETLAGKSAAGGGADKPKSATPTSAIPEGVALAFDESTWETFVRAFIAHYMLDASQEKKCLAIMDGLVEQARHYRQRHKEELEKITHMAAMSAQAYEPIRMLYLDLKKRLDPIPTDAQVRAAAERGPAKPPESGEAGEPAKSAKPAKPAKPEKPKPKPGGK